MTKTQIRQNGPISSSEKVSEDLTVTDGYAAGQNDSTKNLQDDINYLRTAIKDLKGVDDSEASADQKHFSSSHDGIAIVGDGYGKTTGLPEIDGGSPNSINQALHMLNVVSSGGGSSGSAIGPAEDADYTDGLFTDFDTSTPIGTPIDRFNEVLKALVPSEAPSLSNISMSDNGVSDKIAFGTSNVIGGFTNVGAIGTGSAIDINTTFGTTSQRKGIFNGSTTINGIIADSTVAHSYAYPANSFGSGDLGTLELWVNGSLLHSVDLTVFASGNSLTGASGFNLSAATPVEFESGSQFDLFKYRTGTWTIAPADQRSGWNYVQVIHESGVSSTSNFYEWIVDPTTTATTFGGEALDGLSMTGSKFISGVEYHTGGTAQYDITVSNAYRNVFSDSSTAIAHPTTTNCSISNASLGSMTLESDDFVLTNAAVTVSPDFNSRILGGDITVSTRVDRTLNSDLTSTGASGGYALLVDTNSGSGSNTAEGFSEESYRQDSTISLVSTSYSSSPGSQPSVWNETTSLLSGVAADGLMISEGKLQYPTEGTLGGNFQVANGPAGNVDYSGATGDRSYVRYFYAASTHQNFTFNVTATGTTFVTMGTGLSSSNVHFELLAPNTTQDVGATIEWKDMVAAYTDDNSIGAYAASQGGTIPTNWGSTIGTRSTSTSGNVIAVRITASAAWTGSISNISVTFN